MLKTFITFLCLLFFPHQFSVGASDLLKGSLYERFSPEGILAYYEKDDIDKTIKMIDYNQFISSFWVDSLKSRDHQISNEIRLQEFIEKNRDGCIIFFRKAVILHRFAITNIKINDFYKLLCLNKDNLENQQFWSHLFFDLTSKKEAEPGDQLQFSWEEIFKKALSYIL